MITFYPEQLDIWKDEFDFNPPITLLCEQKTNYKFFRNRDDLIGFCKQHGVVLNDPKNFFEITGPETHPQLGGGMYKVTQGRVLGWLKDNYFNP